MSRTLKGLRGWGCAGDGWYDVTIVSPRNFFVYTPLLPSAATGAVELRSITEAVRSLVSGKPWSVQAESVSSPFMDEACWQGIARQPS